jgi:16S rRNA (cytosine1402-N4)-methyltransferase
MKATIIPDPKKHYPVLLKELISIISPQYGGTFIDCTFGQGGYTKKFLDFPKTKVIALDRDSESSKKAEEIQSKFEDRFIFKNIKFSQLKNLKLKNENIRGIIFDLGYSYTQIKDPNKGLSFESIGELNMRMGINDFSAKEVINSLDENELEKIFRYFGEEKESKRIAHNIVEDRKKIKISTEELVRIIKSSKRKKNYKIHSATKVFQALRIFVNKEISELIYGLINAVKIVKKDGIVAVVTFNSLEDKIVKYFFKSLSENKSVSRYLPKNEETVNLLRLINKKPILPSIKEINTNPPSRSSKLR